MRDMICVLEFSLRNARCPHAGCDTGNAHVRTVTRRVPERAPRVRLISSDASEVSLTRRPFSEGGEKTREDIRNGKLSADTR